MTYSSLVLGLRVRQRIVAHSRQGVGVQIAETDERAPQKLAWNAARERHLEARLLNPSHA